MTAPGSDRAIVSITKWARREEWRERLEVIIEAHFGPVFARLDLSVEELPDLLGDAFPGLFGCVLEDFLTCNFGLDQRSVVDDYLKRRGFKERAPVKSYLRALQRSVMSAYRVVAAIPGSHMLLDDLIRDGAPVRVEDRAGSRALAPGDHLAARLLPINGKTWLSTSVLCLAADQAQGLVDDVRRLMPKLRRGVTREAEKRGIAIADLEAVISIDDVILGELAPIFTHTWLTAALEELLGVVLTEEVDPAEALLAQPLPLLGNRSPRQAARSRDGRRQVAQWLKYEEARSSNEAPGELAALAGADLSWMWQALRIEHLR